MPSAARTFSDFRLMSIWTILLFASCFARSAELPYTFMAVANVTIAHQLLLDAYWCAGLIEQRTIGVAERVPPRPRISTSSPVNSVGFCETGTICRPTLHAPPVDEDGTSRIIASELIQLGNIVRDKGFLSPHRCGEKQCACQGLLISKQMKIKGIETAWRRWCQEFR
jgi:hypothetical protein